MNLIRDIGIALYGREWSGPLSEALGVNPRNLRRWAAGSIEPAPGVYLDLWRLLSTHLEVAETKADVLDDLAERLKPQVPVD
jgi:hypothetical protein